MNSSRSLPASEQLLARRKIRSSLLARHCGFEPAAHHRLLIGKLEALEASSLQRGATRRFGRVRSRPGWHRLGCMHRPAPPGLPTFVASCCIFRPASMTIAFDQFNTSGLGTNVPMATGDANESLMALVDGKWVNMRVPYPLGQGVGRGAPADQREGSD
jgi:hypothetical protein